jgi:hypothetical protein
MSTAMAAGDAGSGKSSTLFNTSTDLPQFPGDQDVLAHVATTFRNAAEARLASRGLLAVAQGGMPPAAAQIINVDLTELPELPVDHRDHNRRKETRIRTITANKANDVKRKQLIYDAWTEIYGLVYKSVEVSAPVLAQELKDHCDLATTSGMPGGYFDGPRAWAILLDRLSSGGRRTEADKDFYRAGLAQAGPASAAAACVARRGGPTIRFTVRRILFPRPCVYYMPQQSSSARGCARAPCGCARARRGTYTYST